MRGMRLAIYGDKRGKMPCWLAAFLVNLAVALAAIAPLILVNNGYMAMSHDFSAQEIAFNMLMNDTVKSGNLLWNWGIDLGGNFLESFSFYNVGSVFFWITLLFPAEYMSRVMGWMLILKFAVAGAASAAYLARHVKNDNAAIFGSLLYAFSGFSCGTVVFYHFLDEVALFPLLLTGMELLVEEKKRGRFLAACALNLFCNYIFFVGEFLFLVGYYVVRYLAPRLKEREKSVGEAFAPILSCIVEGAIGCAMTGVLLMPSVYGTLSNSRISSHLPGNAWFSMTTRDWLLLLKAVLVPAEPMNFFSSVTGANWMSNMAYLPLTGMLFVLAYVAGRKDWVGILLKIGFVVASVPILNGMFMFFNTEPYRRWYYMVILIMALASARVAEEPESYRIGKSGIFLLALYAFYWIMLNVVKWDESGNGIVFHKRLFLFGFLAAVWGVLLTLAVVKWGGKRRMRLFCVMAALFSGVSLAAVVFEYQFTTDNTNLDFKTYPNTYGENVYNYLTEVPGMLERDVLPYRYYFEENVGYTYYNLAMTHSLPSINSFISTVHSSVTEYYEQIGLGRATWTSGDNTGTRELLGARYIVSYVEKPEYTYLTEYVNSNGQVMFLYENENALPIGFTYDSYITRSEFALLDKGVRPAAMLGMLVVEDEDAEKTAEVLTHCAMETLAVMVPEQRFEYVRDRRRECSSSFRQEENAFEVQLTADGEKYAFFSVPYDRCWKASVNGQEEEVLNCNGFMAVRVSAGENTISFVYQYKPLKYGMVLSFAGIGAGMLYCFAGRKKWFQIQN